MKFAYRILIFLIPFTLYIVVTAQEECPVITETALATADIACNEMGIDQVCYGNVALEVETIDDADDYPFEEPGDTLEITQLQRLELSPMDEANGAWGIAMMNVRANVPDTAPGQGVTFLLFGDVLLENRESDAVILPITASGNINVRNGAGTDFAVVGSLSTGQAVEAIGRNELGDWLQIHLDSDTRGWVYTPLMTVDDDVSLLSVIESSDEPIVAQSYYFRTGIGDAPCQEAPNSGILIRTPEGIGEISFNLNGIDIELGSTAYVQAGEEFTINVLEGLAKVTAFGETQEARTNMKITVPLDENLAASGPPSLPKKCDLADLQGLPTSYDDCNFVGIQMFWCSTPIYIPQDMNINIFNDFGFPTLEAAEAAYTPGVMSIIIDGITVADELTPIIEAPSEDVVNNAVYGFSVPYHWENPIPGTYEIVGPAFPQSARDGGDTHRCTIVIVEAPED